jgi:hypothetical protein
MPFSPRYLGANSATRAEGSPCFVHPTKERRSPYETYSSVVHRSRGRSLRGSLRPREAAGQVAALLLDLG